MKNVSGPELIRRLGDAKTRLAAFRELAWRSGKDRSEPVNSAEVIVCPQGKDEKPIYIVLTRFDVTNASMNRWFNRRFSGYPVDKPEELFGPLPEHPEQPIPPHGKLDKRGSLVIYAFTADGKELMPFGGDNMLDAGIIADMNGDGIVERADMTNYLVWGVAHAMVLEVRTAAEHPRPLLRALYNWGPKNDWDYQFADRDGDGSIEIEFGPVIAPDVVKPKVVFVWDKAKGGYTAAKGGENAHLRVLPSTSYNDNAWLHLGQLKKQKLVFPIDPEAKGTGRTTMVEIGGDRQGGDPQADEDRSPPPAKPYRRASLKGLTNPQIVAYMGRGKTLWDFHREHIVSTRLPEGFWTLPAKQAAAALVEINRTEEHRRKYRLAIDDRDGRQPPDACSIHYSYRSRRCYFTRDPSYFLRADAKNAYLAYASVSGLGVVFYNVVKDQPGYDLRHAGLPPKDAKHVADVIWWLRRARTWTPLEDSSRGVTWSSADGSGTLRLHSARGVEVKAGGRVWACDGISERWQDHFGEETLVNFVDYLFQVAVPSRLGEQWERQAPTCSVTSRNLLEMVCQEVIDAKQSAQLDRQLARQYRKQIGPLIGLCSTDQSLLPYSMLRIAVDAAGDSALPEFRPPLQAILDQLSASKHGPSPESAPSGLRSAAMLALHKLSAADDPGRLQAWAQTADPGWQWAMARLKKTDKPRYVAALEWWLHKSKGETARQFFEAIREVHPQKAVELARQLPPDRRHDLTVSACSALEQAKAINETNRRVDALIAVMLDRNAGWQQRTRAVGLLVPDETPLKYPDRKIDEALLGVFDHGLGDSIINFTLASACHALAMRGRTEYFDRMLQRFNEENDGEAYSRIRVSLVQLALRGTQEQRVRLSAVLGATLKQTGRDPSGVILCLYVLDRRQWKDDLERIATSGPEDYEGQQRLRGADSDHQAVCRSHDARKIAAIWNEDDLLTRAKLLIAFSFQMQSSPWRGGGERVVPDAIQRQLQELAGGLSPEQAKRVVEFVDYCEKNLDNRSGAKTGFGELARRVFVADPAGK